MTDQNPDETTPPGGDPFAHGTHPGADSGTNGADAAGAAKGREWLAQLETMINDVTTQAAPVARQVAAKAAELTAVAATKAGPFAQRAASATTDASQKLAERANSLAAELRGELPGAPAEDVPWAVASEASDANPEPPAPPPAATSEYATPSEDDTVPGSSI
jgi:hypothetical protein